MPYNLQLLVIQVYRGLHTKSVRKHSVNTVYTVINRHHQCTSCIECNHDR